MLILVVTVTWILLICEVGVGVDLLLGDGPYEPEISIRAVESDIYQREDDGCLILSVTPAEVHFEPAEVTQTESLSYQLAGPLVEDLGEDIPLLVLVGVAGIACGAEVVEDVAGLGLVAGARVGLGEDQVLLCDPEGLGLLGAVVLSGT